LRALQKFDKVETLSALLNYGDNTKDEAYRKNALIHKLQQQLAVKSYNKQGNRLFIYFLHEVELTTLI
jgi:hypothetical protein